MMFQARCFHIFRDNSKFLMFTGDDVVAIHDEIYDSRCLKMHTLQGTRITNDCSFKIPSEIVRRSKLVDKDRRPYEFFRCKVILLNARNS